MNQPDQRTVFVTHEPKANNAGWKPDLSPATKYGGIAYVFDKDEQPFMNTQGAVEQAQERLKNFDSKFDYVCWPMTGDPMALYVTLMVLGEMGIHTVTFLYWSRDLDAQGNRIKGKGTYLPIKVSVDYLNNFNS